MKRIFEFIPADHDIIVSRTLVMVHQAIDASLPAASPPSQRFARTAFGGDDPTLNQTLPGEWSQANLEDTAPRRRPNQSEGSSRLHNELTQSKKISSQRLWRQSIIGVVIILAFALLAYIVFR